MAGGRGVSIPFDISKVAELPALLQQVNQFVGSVDILINNAAIERGFDPAKPPLTEEYPFPPVKHEPYVQEIHVDGSFFPLVVQ